MKTFIQFSLIVLCLFAILVFQSGCKKDGTNPDSRTPTVTTGSISGITDTSALAGGEVVTDGGQTVTVRGVCWALTSNPTTANSKTEEGDGEGIFSSPIRGLMPNTLYHVRAYATNSNGTSYGQDVSFTTTEALQGTVVDVDGNSYRTVRINGKIWMAENLKTTRYRNGDSIPNLINASPWAIANSGGYCNYNNDPNNGAVYGRLYNWYAVSDSRNLAPAGWHVARAEEWQALVDSNGGRTLAGGVLKETGNLHWNVPNHGAKNLLLFSALPGGNRNDLAVFYNLRANGFWWTSTEIIVAGSFGVHFSMYTNTAYCERANADKHMGFSVRCVKD